MAPTGLLYWLTAWNLNPTLWIGYVVVVGLYLYAVGPLRKKYHLAEHVKRGQMVWFLLGATLMLLALVSPLDELGDTYWFSAHMVQHLFLTVVGPPLLILGIPAWLVKPLLKRRTLYLVARGLTHPVVAFMLYNVDFWLWHAPPLYDAALSNEWIHVLEHVTFIVFAVIYWWPVLSPLEEGLPRLPIGGQILYLFLSGMPSVLLGAGLTFSPPLYQPYIAAPRLLGISAATDQQLGGLIMWVPVSILYIAIMSALFIRWMQRQEIAQRERELAEWERETEKVQ